MVAVETIGAVLVISVTALLVNSPPPQDTAIAVVSTPAAKGPAVATVVSNGYRFAITADPNGAGPTMLMVAVTKGNAVSDVFELHSTLQSPLAAIAPIDVTFQSTKGTGVYQENLFTESHTVQRRNIEIEQR